MNLPDLEHPSTIPCTPDAQNVFTIPDAHDSTTDFVTGIAELVTNERKHQIFPVAIRNTLLEAHDPLSALSVLFILPDGPDALLEQVVVGNKGQSRGPLEMPVYCPELLGSADCGYTVHSVLVGNVTNVLGDRGAVPETPAVAQQVVG